MKRFKELMKMLWDAMDGNKSIIGLAILNILQFAPLPPPWQIIAITLVSVFTGVSAKQHFIDKKMYLPDRR